MNQDSFSASLFGAVHDYLGGISSYTRKGCCQIAAAHNRKPHGLQGLSSIHIGAGFGADMVEAYRHGVDRAVGVEYWQSQIDLSALLWQGDFAKVVETVESDPITTTLYTSDQRAECLRRMAYDRAGWNAHGKDRGSMSIIQGNALDRNIQEQLEPADILIAHRVLPHLSHPQRVLGVLEDLASLVKVGGRAVFSLHDEEIGLVENEEDERRLSQMVFRTPIYKEASVRLYDRLQGRISVPWEYLHASRHPENRFWDCILLENWGSTVHRNLPPGPLRCIQIIDDCVVGTADLETFLRGYLLWEAQFLTEGPFEDVAKDVAAVMDRIKATYDPVQLALPPVSFAYYLVFERV